MIGLFVAYRGDVTMAGWVIGIAVVFSLVACTLGCGKLLAIVLIAALIGYWRGGAMYKQLQRYQGLYGESVTMSGSVADDPGFNTIRNQTEFTLTHLQVDVMKLPGRVEVGSREDLHLNRGDTVIVNGKLRPSKGTSRQGTLSMARVRVVHKNTSGFEKLRRKFIKTVNTVLPGSNGGLGLGYIVGVRVAIPEKLSEQLSIVGLTHIVAVSGYNLTIIVQAVRRIFAKRSAYQSCVISFALVGGFIAVTGGSAPIVRAALVCSIGLLAWYYGREVSPLLLLLLSGAVTAFANPLYIWGDPGWYLSFLAFAGVLVLAPLITKRYFVSKQPGTIAQILIETLCAQACTIPYTLYLFGGVSVIAPLANVLILPFIPVIMLLVFVLGLIGMIAVPIATVAAIIPMALLTLQIWLIEKLSHVSGAHRDITISTVSMVILFAVLVAISIVLHHSVKRAGNAENLNTQA
jgi:competence protein ComEC